MIRQETNGTMLIIAKRGNGLRQIFRWRGIRLRSAFLHGFAQEIIRKALRNLSRGSSFGTLSPCIRNQHPGCKHKHAGSGNEERTTVHIAPTFYGNAVSANDASRRCINARSWKRLRRSRSINESICYNRLLIVFCPIPLTGTRSDMFSEPIGRPAFHLKPLADTWFAESDAEQDF